MKDILIVQNGTDDLLGLTEGLGFYARYFNCITARSGKTAMEILKTAVFDVVITGTTMPDMSGPMFVRQVSENHPNATIFVMTESGDRETGSWSEAMVAARLLDKPLDVSELARSIMAH